MAHHAVTSGFLSAVNLLRSASQPLVGLVVAHGRVNGRYLKSRRKKGKEFRILGKKDFRKIASSHIVSCKLIKCGKSDFDFSLRHFQ